MIEKYIMKRRYSPTGYLINNWNFVNYNFPLMTGSALLAIFIFNRVKEASDWSILLSAIMFIILAGLCRPMREQF